MVESVDVLRKLEKRKETHHHRADRENKSTTHNKPRVGRHKTGSESIRVSEVGRCGGDGKTTGGPGEGRAKVLSLEPGEGAFGRVEEEVESDGSGSC
jgi:hypothetical protein